MPKIRIMEGMLNHIRIISVDAFRMIPQHDLRDVYGKYYTDRVIIAMILLEMINKPSRDA